MSRPLYLECVMVTRAIIVAVLALAAPDGASCLAAGASKLKKAKGGRTRSKGRTFTWWRSRNSEAR